MVSAPPSDPERADDRPVDPLRALVGCVRAHLAWEAELGGVGVPRATVANRSAPARVPVPTRAARDAVEAPPTVVGPPSGTTRTTRLPLADVTERLEGLAREASGCTACELHRERTQSVFARGALDAELVFVGEGPGAEEDRTGLPFVGPAGQLLDRMVAAMGYERDAVYICNVVKCRPPGNRTPSPDEALACAKFLHPQLELMAPRVIVALGRCAALHLGVARAEGAWRGRWGSYGDVPVMPTYHPAFLLRSPEQKRTVWEDLQQVMARLGRKPPPRQR